MKLAPLMRSTAITAESFGHTEPDFAEARNV
jgi:hypothetical protein